MAGVTEPIAIQSEYKGLVPIATYNPFLSSIGLPSKNEAWRLEGFLNFKSHYGEVRKTVCSKEVIRVNDSGNWEEAREYVLRRIREFSGG